MRMRENEEERVKEKKFTVVNGVIITVVQLLSLMKILIILKMMMRKKILMGMMRGTQDQRFQSFEPGHILGLHRLGVNRVRL